MMEKRGVSRERCLEILSKGGDGVLCTNGADGFPYAAPVDFILLDDVIYVHGRNAGEKLDNVVRDPRVCFTTYTHECYEITGPETCNVTTDYVSVIVRGRCSLVTDQAEKERILFEIVRKLVPEHALGPVNPEKAARTAVFAIALDNVTGKVHPTTPGNRTAPSVH